jgi:hypothetical protein
MKRLKKTPAGKYSHTFLTASEHQKSLFSRQSDPD